MARAALPLCVDALCPVRTDQSLWDSFLKAVSDDLPGMRSVEKLKKLLAAACAVWALLLIPVWYFYTYSPDCGGAVGLSWLLAFGATYQALLWVGRREIKAADARCAQIAERYGAPFKESKVSIRYKRYDYKDVSGGATLLEFALTSTAGP